MTPYGVVRRLEREHRLDDAADALDRGLPDVFDDARVRQVLSGTWLGHALHPMLTDVPIGTWTSATLLDLLGGDRWRTASATLTAVGLAASVPTVASGIVDWRDTPTQDRRVGVVHAAANAFATVCYTASLAAKLTGRSRLGRLASATGAVALGVGGYLGGHLSYARGAGVDHTVLDRERTETFEVTRVVGGELGTVVTREVSGDRFLVLGSDGGRFAVPGWCTRCGTDLDLFGPTLLQCPRDDSRFDAAAGTVARGPATTPLPRFDVVTDRDRLMLRRDA